MVKFIELKNGFEEFGQPGYPPLANPIQFPGIQVQIRSHETRILERR